MSSAPIKQCTSCNWPTDEYGCTNTRCTQYRAAPSPAPADPVEQVVDDGFLANFGGAAAEEWSETTIDNEGVAWVLRSEAEVRVTEERMEQEAELASLRSALLAAVTSFDWSEDCDEDADAAMTRLRKGEDEAEAALRREGTDASTDTNTSR